MPQKRKPQNRQPSKKRKEPKARRHNTPSKADVVRLSRCEEVYLRALANPFDPEISGEVCYPSFPVKKSVKLTGQRLVNVSIGTQGLGWIMYDITPANELPSIFYTDSSYAGNSGTAFTTTTGSGVASTAWVTNTSSSAFNETAWSTTKNQFRVVAAGAKFRYTGTELNRGGSAFVVTNPQQTTLSGYTIGNVADPTISRELPVSMDYQTVALPPSHDEDLDWKDYDQIFPWSDGGGTTAAPFQAIMFSGTPGNSFVVRLIFHYEVAGSSFNAYASASHAGDPQLINSITAASTAATFSAQTAGKSYLEQFSSALKNISHNPLVRRASNMLTEIAFGYASRRLGAPRQMLRIAGTAIDVD